MAYKKFALGMAVNTVLMFLIPYATIEKFDHLYFNLNRVYMTLMMVAPMAIVMLLVMHSMFDSKRMNYLLYGSLTVMFLVCFALVRTQALVGNSQAMQSMIPNHSSTILVCQESDITDPQVKKLCNEIVASQEAQIEQMKAMLAHSQ